MLFAECFMCHTRTIVRLSDRIGVVDTEDGIMELANSSDLETLLKKGIAMANVMEGSFKGVVYVEPFNTMQHYSIGDKFFAFKRNEVYVFFGNDYMIHLQIVVNTVYLNNRAIGFGDCFGVPGRRNKDSEFIIRVFKDYIIYDTITLDRRKAVYAKNCKVQYMRKSLF